MKFKYLMALCSIFLSSTCQFVFAQAVDVDGLSSVSSAFSAISNDGGQTSTIDPTGGSPVLQIIAEPRVDPANVLNLGAANAQRDAADAALQQAQTVGLTARRIGLTDLIVFEATQAQLQDLIDTGVIQSIQVDEPLPPSMASAAPGIQLPSLHAENIKGHGQSVVVVDTGVDSNHPHLSQRVSEQACFSTTNSVASTLCPNGQNEDFGSNAARPCDVADVASCDHGTHVAAIAAGSTTNPLDAGVAPNANIIAIQAFSRFDNDAYCGVGGSPCVLSYTSDQLAALSFVERTLATRHPIAAINMSLGGGRYSQCDNNILSSVISRLRAINIATVISSGNNGYPDHVGAPGCISSAITVGAVFDNGNITWFSNSGDQVDLLAPGYSIFAAVPGNGTGTKSGTSMAAPMVSGLIAGLQAYAPQSVDAIEDLIKQTGVDRPTLNSSRLRPWIRAHDAWFELDKTLPNAPDVWMKDQWADTGEEPNRTGQTLSGSPYIWFRHQADCAPAAHQSQNPDFGDPSFGCVKIHNQGKVAEDGELHLFWARANFDNKASWSAIAKYPMTMPPTSTKIVSLPWAQVPHPGHYCAIARWVPNGDDPTLSFPGGFQETIRRSNDHIWRNFDVVNHRSGKYPSGLTFSSEHDGTVNLVIEVSKLGPSDQQLLGELLVKLGIDPNTVNVDPTQSNIHIEGDTLIVPLRPGATYIPEINLPSGQEHEFELEFRFRGVNDQIQNGPLMSVKLADVDDVALHKQTGESEISSFTYEIVD